MKVSSFAYRLVLALIVLNVNSSSEAHSTAENVETSNVIRIHTATAPSPSHQPKVAPICQPGNLNPAISCACYAYSKFQLEDAERKLIEDLCKEPYFDNENGYASCSSSNFTKSGKFSFADMNKFFDDVRESCAYPGTPYAEDDARFMAEKAIWKGREETVISLEEYSYGAPLIRLPRAVHRRNLCNFCLVLTMKKGISRARAYRRCCPSPRTPSQPSPSPSPSPEYRICQPRILHPAVRCGCSGYSPYYLNKPTFSNLTQFCRDELDNDIQSGMASCPYTNFTKSGEFDYAVMNQYFHNAREICVHPGTAPSQSARFNTKETPSWNVREDVVMREFGEHSRGSPVIRITKEKVRPMLCHFCIVLGNKNGYSFEYSYSKCCSKV